MLLRKTKVYLTTEGLEADEIDPFNIRRRRILFDEVQMVSYHRFIRPWFVALTAVPGVLFGFLFLVTLSNAAVTAMLFFFIALFCLVPLLLHLTLRIDAVTICGKRCNTSIHFNYRKSEARRVYASLCDRIQREQALRAEAEAPIPTADPWGTPPTGLEDG